MMRNILCYGDSNTWGNIAGGMNVEYRLAERFAYDVRWPGVMQQLLGKHFHVIEAGLNGRTTAFDETSVIRSSRNGLATLPGILEMYYPLDLVIFMLGTNDVKIEYNVSVAQITAGMQALLDCVKSSHFGPKYKAPKLMFICPAPIIPVENEIFNTFYSPESIVKSQQLIHAYSKLAETLPCVFLNAAPFVTISKKDGVHYEVESHTSLAKAIAAKVGSIIW